MRRYYFDLRDGGVLVEDEEGIELPDIESVQEEAARSLVDIAKDMVRGNGDSSPWHRMVIEVRDDNGPVLRAKFTFEMDETRH
jgi:hypothetical protein